jgi:hypothetical protein
MIPRQNALMKGQLAMIPRQNALMKGQLAMIPRQNDLMERCSVEIISLTPRFNAVNHERAREKPFKRFFSASPFAPG